MKTKPKPTTLRQLITAAMTRAGESPEFIQDCINHTIAVIESTSPGAMDLPLPPDKAEVAKAKLMLMAKFKLNRKLADAARN